MPERLTLDQMPAHIPTPNELYEELMSSPGWSYKSIKKDDYLIRDKSLVSVLYLGSLRTSEAIPLTKDQFSQPIEDERGKYITIRNVCLAKRREGKVETNNVDLPLEGERVKFTQLILDYLKLLKPKERLYPWSLEKVKVPIKGKNAFYINRKGEKFQRYSVRMIGTARAWKIVKALLPNITQHWLRAYGEDFFYVLSGKDLVATAHKFKVDPRTLANWYLKRRHLEVPVR